MTQTAAAAVAKKTTLAILVHVLGLFTSWLAPLFIYLISKSDPDDQFTAANAKEALNFQLNIFLWTVLSFFLMFIVIGIFLIWAVALANLVLCIVAAVKASNGVAYRYPMIFRMIG